MGTGRHAVRGRLSRRGGRPRTRLVLAAVLAVALLAGGLTWIRSGGDGDTCRRELPVNVTVAPEVAAIATQALAAPLHVGGGVCARGHVFAASPLQTVGDLLSLTPDKLPDVWVPDSSLWALRATRGPQVDVVGHLASSPVVIAVSQSVADRFGWIDKPATWADSLTTALAAGQGMAAPAPQTAIDLVATTVLFRSLGGVDKAQVPVLQAVLATARDAWTPESGLAAGRKNLATAPLVAAREQDVIAGNRANPGSSLVAIYPSDGTPSLDYPIARVSKSGASNGDAVDAVIAALTSPATTAAALAAGFRDTVGNPPADAGTATGTSRALPKTLDLDPDEVLQSRQQADSLLQPSRILAVLDVSTSMRARAGNTDRITLAQDAMKSTLALLPDSYAVGLWAFASRLTGDQDWAVLEAPTPLGRPVASGTERDRLNTLLDTLPTRVSGGGTAIYDTTLAAVRSARASYDPAAVNSVMVLTDGKNEDTSGISLQQLLQTLAAENDPSRPVQVLGIALGPDADRAALDQIAAATQGVAYSAGSSADLQPVLFDALRHRSPAKPTATAAPDESDPSANEPSATEP